MPRPPRTRLAILLAGGAVLAAALTLWLLREPAPPVSASRAERIYHEYCADCHGRDGRGSWRSLLFMVNPGDLADPGSMARQTDQYLFDLIKHGGSPIGRPGMPGFGFHLTDEEIRDLVGYLRRLSGASRS